LGTRRRYVKSPVAVTVRPEAPSDARAVRGLLVDAFGGPDEADFVDELRRRPDVFTLVAERDRSVVGAITFSPVFGRARDVDVRAMGLAPMAVRPDRQRRGIGSALI
jgi:putative acetyltransferase